MRVYLRWTLVSASLCGSAIAAEPCESPTTLSAIKAELDARVTTDPSALVAFLGELDRSLSCLADPVEARELGQLLLAAGVAGQLHEDPAAAKRFYRDALSVDPAGPFPSASYGVPSTTFDEVRTDLRSRSQGSVTFCADVYLDGNAMSAGDDMPVRAGRHFAQATSPGGLAGVWIVVGDGEQVLVTDGPRRVMRKRCKRSKTLEQTLLIAGGALLLGGGALVAKSYLSDQPTCLNGTSARADGGCAVAAEGDLEPTAALTRARNTEEAFGWVLAGTGLAAAGTGAALWWFASPAPDGGVHAGLTYRW